MSLNLPETVNTVPRPLRFGEAVREIWSILRGRRYRSASAPTVLYTFKPYVVQVRYETGETVIFQSGLETSWESYARRGRRVFEGQFERPVLGGSVGAMVSLLVVKRSSGVVVRRAEFS